MTVTNHSQRQWLLSRVANLALGRGIASVLSAVWLIVLARNLPLPAFGDVAVVLALGAVFTALSDPGMLFVLGKDVAQRGRIAGVLLRSVILRRQVAAAVCVALTVALYLPAASDKDPVVPLIFGISILASAAYGSALIAYRSLGNVTLEAVNEVVSRAGVLAVGWVLITHGGGIRAAVGVYAAADLASALVIVPIVFRRYVKGGSVTGLPSLGLRNVLPYAMAGAVVIVYYRIDTYLVGLLRSSADAGMYGAAYKLLDGALIPAIAVASLVIAQTGRLAGAVTAGVGVRMARTALLVTLPQVVVGVILAGPLLGLTFGPGFVSASPILVVLLLSAIPSAAVLVLAQLSAVSDARSFLAASVFGLVLNVVLNILVIPAYGGLGAAWVNVASQSLLAVALVYAIRRNRQAASAAAP